MNLFHLIIPAIVLTTMTLSQPVLPASDGPQARITVDARETLCALSPYMTGACIEDVNHEIYGGLYSQMVYGESFQEPPPLSRMPDFQPYGGDWTAEHGEVRVSGGDGPKLILKTAPLVSGAVAVEMLLPERNGGPAGLIVNVSDPSAGADNFNGYEISLDPSQNVVVLGRHRRNWEPISRTPYEIPVGQWIKLTAETKGGEIAVSIDGKQVVSYHDAEHPLPPGMVGLRTWQRAARYRNLTLQNENVYVAVPFKSEGESTAVSGMWRPVIIGTAQGQFDIENDAPFIGRQSQRIQFEEGSGEIGVENRGLNRWGMAFQSGKPYEGVLWARAKAGEEITVALQSADGAHTYAETALHPKGTDWERLTFTLTPNQTDPSGRMAILLRHPGSVTLGYAFLQPGSWGRFHELPVRKDVAEGLLGAGLTVLRYGGSMVNIAGYRWKQMVGPRDRRPPYQGLWYPYSSNGWGIPDFLSFCEAAGVLGIPAFCMDETPQDMADFIEYANGPADSPMGRQRVADGHPKPYHIRYIELGNEEAVDEHYWQRFEPMIRAIWAKDPHIIPVVGDFAYDHPITDPYHFTGAPRIQSLAAHKKILDLAKEMGKEVWFDVHVWNQEADEPHHVEGVATFSEQLGKLSPGAKYDIVVFELNANKHGMQRALATGRAVNQLQRIGDKVRIVCSANGLQPDGQNDNGWDQGLLFLNPSQVWAQPPYYAMQMLAHNALPLRVWADAQEAHGKLDVTALKSEDGKILSLQVVNSGAEPIPTRLLLEGFEPKHLVAQVTSLSGPLEATNTASSPRSIVPSQHPWAHQIHEGQTEYTFPAYSFTILRFE
jgi:alpha-L-arabinofuranosidase